MHYFKFVLSKCFDYCLWIFGMVVAVVRTIYKFIWNFYKFLLISVFAYLERYEKKKCKGKKKGSPPQAAAERRPTAQPRKAATSCRRHSWAEPPWRGRGRRRRSRTRAWARWARFDAGHSLAAAPPAIGRRSGRSDGERAGRDNQ